MDNLIELTTQLLVIHRAHSDEKIGSVIQYLEERDRLSYLAWYRATRDLKGDWSHITRPLFEQWQDAGEALMFMLKAAGRL